VKETIETDDLGAADVDDLDEHAGRRMGDDRADLGLLHDRVEVHSPDDRVDVHLLDHPIHVDAVDQGVHVDRGENPIEVGTGEQRVDIDPAENSFQIDAIENPVDVDAVDQCVHVDLGEQRVDVDPLDEGVEIDPVEQRLDVEVVEEGVGIDPIDEALHVDAIDDALDIEPFDHFVDVDGVDDTGGHLLGDRAHDPGRPAGQRSEQPTARGTVGMFVAALGLHAPILAECDRQSGYERPPRDRQHDSMRAIGVEVWAIGRVESPLVDLADAPRQGDEGAPDADVVFDPGVAAAMRDLRAGDELLLLTWLDRARRDVLTVHPRDEPGNPLRGVFSTRSSDRPNPIGLHQVTVVAVDGTRVRVRPLEAIDGTPVIDVKPVLEPLGER
jgi:tRNA-Thr(GGU) m(6)t(6)A37 methyltransferase TsaA